ncbi:hypothetical protein [Nonomuraea sp. NPDC049028]|uniref:hypothetical protein n=1 Tax=Nonomuraea sp. NPDC049028 TaxID=3364348 RepID=UPI00371DFC25
MALLFRDEEADCRAICVVLGFVRFADQSGVIPGFVRFADQRGAVAALADLEALGYGRIVDKSCG